jgi:hypothetical protein
MNAVLESPDIEEKTKRLAEQSRERREKERMTTAERQAAAKSADDPETVPVSRGKMLNLPETVGLAGLHIRLRAIPSINVPDLVQSFLSDWPPVIYVSSKVPPRDDGTLDIETIALYSTQIRQAAENLSAEDKGREPIEVRPTDVEDVLIELGEFEANVAEYIDAIADSVWMLAKDINPGIAWPKPQRPADAAADWTPTPPDGCQWLSDLLLPQLTLPDYVRLPLLLLRANSCGGGYCDDLDKRFFASWRAAAAH